MNIDLVIFSGLLWAIWSTRIGAEDCSNWNPAQIDITEKSVSQKIAEFTFPDSAITYLSHTVSLLNFDSTLVKSFFDLVAQDHNLSLSTTEAFGTLGENFNTAGATAYAFITVEMTCDGNNIEQALYVAIKDSFSRELEFSNPSGYSYSLPMPIMPNTAITAYGDAITVYDVNFSNENMIFSISPGDFEVTVSQLDERHFQALLNPIKILQFSTSQTYTLTATDSGQQTKSINVEIAVNATAGFDSPQFSRSYYSFYYSSLGELSGIGEDVAITSVKAASAEYQLGGELASSFQVVFDSNTQIFTLSLNSENPLPSTTGSQILLTLSFSTDVVAETVLIIDVEHVELIPVFSSLHYKGIYDPDSKTISLDEQINIQDALSVTLDNDVQELILIDQSTYAITPKAALSTDDFDESLNLVFSMIATSTTQNSSSAAVVLSYLKSTFHFDSPLYRAEYSEDGTVAFVDVIGFEETIDYSNIDIAVDADFSNYFRIVCENSEWRISVEEKLSVEILDGELELLIPITASLSGQTTSAVLRMSLPTQILVQFGADYYTALYSVKSDESDSLQLNEQFSVTGADSSLITVNFGDYQDYFKFNPTTNSVDLVANLESSKLADTLIVPISAYLTSHPTTTASTLLIIDVESEASELEFVQKHYSAQYQDESDPGTVELVDGPIRLQNDDNLDVEFSIEGYDDYLELVPDDESSPTSYSINVLKSLPANSASQIPLTITASSAVKKLTSFTVLVLDLPTTDSLQPSFDQKHYSGTYSVDDSGSATVELDDDSIAVKNLDNIALTFSFEGFEGNFDLSSDSDTSTYKVVVRDTLSEDTLDNYSELIMTVTAWNADNNAVADTVLVLSLPSKSTKIQFGKTHYSAQYVKNAEDELATVSILDGPILLQNANYEDLQFSYEGYEENFQLIQDLDGSYSIQVRKNLDDTEEQLVINVAASSTSGNAAGYTVLVIDVAAEEKSMEFDRKYYTATYMASDEPFIKLDDNIALKTVGYSALQLSLEGFSDFLEIQQLDVADQTYGITISNPLDDSVLSLSAELFITVTALDVESGANTATILVLKLPSYIEDVFKSTHYEAEYVEGTDAYSVRLLSPLLVKQPQYTQLTIPGYESNLQGSCDASSLQCTISVSAKLNDSTLTAEQLLLTLTASNEDQSSKGKATLLLQLPAKNATLQFKQSFYSAEYSIETSSEGLGGLTLLDDIAVEGSYADDLSIISDLPEYLEFSLVSSTWTVKLLKNFQSDILAANSTLLVTLTAQQSNRAEYGKAVLAVKLPDKTTVAFSALSYSAQYVLDDKPHVELATPIETLQATNSYIMVNGAFNESFELQLEDSSWTINTISPLITSILSQFSELQLQLTISKVGVSYGEAVLLIQLPTFSFSQDVYSATYLVDENNSPSVSGDDIELANSDSDYIEVTLANYSEFFYTEAEKGVWSIKLQSPLPASITEIHDVLVTNLLAQRRSDGVLVASTSLTISLPIQDSEDAPKFANFVFYGDYLSDEPPTVQMHGAVEFANDNAVSIASVEIDSYDEYSSNFQLLLEEDSSKYNIVVVEALDEGVLGNTSSIVLTLVATSTQGKTSSAALVIALPKLVVVRNSSVEVDNEEVLFTATYSNGTFTSPRILLHFAADTDDSDISVVITNDLGIDNGHFLYSYSANVLTIGVDQLPEDVLNKTSMIPLKLAITDRKTNDTVYAVVAVNIAADSAQESGGYAGRTALIVAVSILAVLLLLLLLAGFLFWMCVLRKTKKAQLVTNEVEVTTKTTVFTKNEGKKPLGGLSNAALRRPTGLPAIVPEESLDNLGSYSTPEPERKVGFDENVEKIHNTEEGSDEGLKSVADRRPTKFVSGYPLELGLYEDRPVSDIPEERRRSLDLPEDKKKVAFDVVNVERMDIEPDEEDEENEERPESTVFKTETELDIKASQEFEEIF